MENLQDKKEIKAFSYACGKAFSGTIMGQRVALVTSGADCGGVSVMMVCWMQRVPASRALCWMQRVPASRACLGRRPP